MTSPSRPGYSGGTDAATVGPPTPTLHTQRGRYGYPVIHDGHANGLVYAVCRDCGAFHAPLAVGASCTFRVPSTALGVTE